jgi:hypothetical protein
MAHSKKAHTTTMLIVLESESDESWSRCFQPSGLDDIMEDHFEAIAK